jgi:hypothetical protein
VSLTHRTQILLDDERHALLRRRSAVTGRSVGDLIREAIDRQLADADADERAAASARERALEGFLAADPMPVEDWSEVERELEGALERGSAAD